METRFDFYRILLPGGLALALVDGMIRIVSASIGFDSAAACIAMLQFLEDPLRGAALAFGMGVVFYLIEPGNSAPQYYKDIPSTHLRAELEKRGINLNPVALFFRASDELMPSPLRERALMYGAFYRVGFQAVVFTLLGCALVPAFVLGTTPTTASPWQMLHGTSRTGLVVTCMITLVLAGYTLVNARQSSWSSMWLLLCGLPSWLGWANLRNHWFAPSWMPPRSTAYVLLGVTVLVWLLLRLRGPFPAYLDQLRHGGPRPDVPHSDSDIAFLDLAVVSASLVGCAAVAPALRSSQSLAIDGLLVLGFVLSTLKKHERRMHGIYRNQAQWLDDHLDEVIGLSSVGKAITKDVPHQGHQGQGGSESGGTSA